jgi:hypothetical protein
MLYVLHALTPWKYVICVTNAAFMTERFDAFVFLTWIYYYTIVMLVFNCVTFANPLCSLNTLYYCPLLCVAVSSHHTGNVTVLYVILNSCLIHSECIIQWLQTQQCHRLSKVKSQHIRYIENETPQPYIGLICFGIFYGHF